MSATPAVELVAAAQRLLAGIPERHRRHVLVVVDDDGAVRLEQRSAWAVWARCNALPGLARQLDGWRSEAMPVFVVGDDIAELRGFRINSLTWRTT